MQQPLEAVHINSGQEVISTFRVYTTKQKSISITLKHGYCLFQFYMRTTPVDPIQIYIV
jgi:hypothetical protein